ncbi:MULTISPECIES: hypothetical protein [Streptomyces]|uniref:Uncharacterized protein n=1 Tax=Streptomyces lonegramiae TaxID=3075524 RepID=A0ABU2XX50_9ACTN|nr:hypothetical protein [Streptomyces sp. DSM 41529]MDT0550181.1 hypothetical protein [Streptomyces sp. DSM 41529]
MSHAEQIRFGLPRIPIGWTIPLMHGIDPAPPYVPHFAHERAETSR